MPTPKYDKNRGYWRIDGMRNGKRKVFYSKTPGLKGKREVMDAFDAWASNGTITMTVENAVSLFLEDIIARQGEKSDAYRTASIYSRLYILPALGKCQIGKVSINDWQAVINNATPVKSDAPPLSKKTLSNIRAVINQLHKFCYENYYCDEWRGSLYIPKGRRIVGKEILQPKDIKKLFEPSDLQYYPAFLIMLLCGLRPGECLGLQKDDVDTSDPRGAVLHIRRSINDNNEITSGKNDNALRDVPLPPLALEIINNTIARNLKRGHMCPWIFCGYRGAQPNQDKMRRQWNRLKAERGLPSVPYGLRHTYVSIVSSQTGGQIASGTLREIIGHSESMDTYGVYKKPVKGEIESAASVIDLTFRAIAK